MTCIVGLVQDGRVLIGGDSASTSGDYTVLCKYGKVFRVGEFIFGVSGSWRVLQLLKYSFNIPPVEGDIMRYMCTTFVTSLRGLISDNDVKIGDDGEWFEFLVGWDEHLFKVCCDYQISTTLDDYNACGSGMDYALAAFYNMDLDMCATLKVERALETASKFCNSVSPPFSIIKSV